MYFSSVEGRQVSAGLAVLALAVLAVQ